MRRAAKRDTHEAAIVRVLRLSGWSVARWSDKDVPDLVIARAWICLLAEIKTGNKPLRPGQEKWHDEWNGSGLLILRDVEDVIVLNRWFQLVVSMTSPSLRNVLSAPGSAPLVVNVSQPPSKQGRTTSVATRKRNGTRTSKQAVNE